MKYTYTQGWFIAHKKPLKIWDVVFAAEQHTAKKPYTVLVGENPERPELYLVINFSTNFIGVTFLDQQLRNFLEYRFTLQENKFFLGQTFQRFFEKDTEQVIKTETHNFSPTGQLTLYVNDAVKNETVTRETTQAVDVSKHWEEIPDFGNYERFARIER